MQLPILVISSNLGPVLLRFRDIVGFCSSPATPTPISRFSPELWSVPVGLDRRCCGFRDVRDGQTDDLIIIIIIIIITRKRCTGQVLPSVKYRPKITSPMNAPTCI